MVDDAFDGGKQSVHSSAPLRTPQTFGPRNVSAQALGGQHFQLGRQDAQAQVLGIADDTEVGNFKTGQFRSDVIEQFAQTEDVVDLDGDVGGQPGTQIERVGLLLKQTQGAQ